MHVFYSYRLQVFFVIKVRLNPEDLNLSFESKEVKDLEQKDDILDTFQCPVQFSVCGWSRRCSCDEK